MGRIGINYFSTEEVLLICDTALQQSITVTRPIDTPNTGWNNELLETGNFMSGDMEFKFTIDSAIGNTPQMIGLDSDDPNASYNSIDYAVYLYTASGTNLLRVYENGTYRGNFPAWTVGDEITIKRTGTLIEYLNNGTVFYTSTVASTVDLKVGDSFYYADGFWGTGSITLNNISLCQV